MHKDLFGSSTIQCSPRVTNQPATRDPATVDAWVDASKAKSPALDKDLMSETFLRFKGAEAGEFDWRPTETIPEDFYAM